MDADETLEVRTERRVDSPTPIVLQRWITPWASIPLAEDPISVASSRGLVGIISADGEAHVIDISTGDKPQTRPLNGAASDEISMQLTNALTRHQERGRQPWANTARIDGNTVATTHRGAILVGTSGPITKR